jgi:hypothetical protein
MKLRGVTASLTIATLICTGGFKRRTCPPCCEKADVEQIVQEYIQHPEVLMESVVADQEREQAAQYRSKAAIAAKNRELFNDAASPAASSADAEATILQLLYYNCGYWLACLVKAAVPPAAIALQSSSRARQ